MAEDLKEVLSKLEKSSILDKAQRIGYVGDAIVLSILRILDDATRAIEERNLEKLKKLRESLIRVRSEDMVYYDESIEKEEGIKNITYPLLHYVRDIETNFNNVVKKAEEGDWIGARWILELIYIFRVNDLTFDATKKQAIGVYKILEERSKEKLGEAV